jgi:transposase InsO family protein/Flp pilus assembly protein TadD
MARNRATLARHVTNAASAHSAIWEAVDQLGARIERTDGGVHSIARNHLPAILEQHGCSALPNDLIGQLAAAKPYVVVHQTELELPLGVSEALAAETKVANGATGDSLDVWRARYEMLVGKLEAQDPESALREAGQALASGDYDEAAARLDKAVAVAKHNAALLGTAYHSRGDLFLLEYRQTDALESYKLAYETDPRNNDFITDYGNLLVALQKYEQARNLFRSAIQRSPDDVTSARWHCNLGTALMCLEQTNEAQQIFAVAERLFASGKYSSSQERDDLVHGLYLNRGVLYEKLGLHHEALDCYGAVVAHFREQVKRSPSDALCLGRIAPNVLRRQFDADAPNQKWVTDITEFRVGDQKLYLSPVMDLYNNEIASYEMATRPVFTMVARMLKKAMKRLGPDERPVVHSDQGWHYQMRAYQALLSERNLPQSMSRKGNCHDNATMESFFGTLKSEFFYLNRFESVEALQAGIKKYIHYYNHDRIKMKLNGLSPVMYRTQPSRP